MATSPFDRVRAAAPLLILALLGAQAACSRDSAPALAARADPQKLAHTLLVELLAYHFASPVRWIETQHLFFTSLAAASTSWTIKPRGSAYSTT